MATAAEFLFFAEDAGAANFIAPLPAELAARGRAAIVVAAGLAAQLLAERGVACQRMPQEPADALLARLQPRAIVVGTASNPKTPGLALIDAARGRALPSVGLVDAAMNARLRFRGTGPSALQHAPDSVLVPDEWTRRQFLALGLSPGRVIAAGNPHHEFVAARSRLGRRNAKRPGLFTGAGAHRRVIVFVSEGSRRIAGGRTERALEDFLRAFDVIEPRPFIVLRIHPRDDAADYAQFRDRVDRVSGTEPALEAVAAADLVVGMTSQLLTEAALLGRPTLALIQRREERNWLPGVRLGVTPCVSSARALGTTLRGLLHGRQDRGARLARVLAVAGTASRVANLLEALAAGATRR